MKIEAIIEEHAHHFLQGLRTECDGDKAAAVIIHKYLKGEAITPEEDHILKTQLLDSLKIVGIGVPFVMIPGASIIMPILIKVADKHNIELMPAAFIIPKIGPDLK
jgi:hypothetical protein